MTYAPPQKSHPQTLFSGSGRSGFAMGGAHFLSEQDFISPQNPKIHLFDKKASSKTRKW
jgi:hypothetical protein